jgi:predicted GNAT family acetyltransferase
MAYRDKAAPKTESRDWWQKVGDHVTEGGTAKKGYDALQAEGEAVPEGRQTYDPYQVAPISYDEYDGKRGTSWEEAAHARFIQENPNFTPGYGADGIENPEWDNYATGHRVEDPTSGSPEDSRSWRDYMIGRDPNYVNQQAEIGSFIGGGAGNQVMALGNETRMLGGHYAADMVGLSRKLEATADEARNVSAPQINASGADFAGANDAISTSRAYGGAMANEARSSAEMQRGIGRDLGAVEMNEGPSAAQAQLQLGSNASMDQAMAIARSGRGYGGSAQGIADANRSNAATMANTSNQAAMLRAQENAAWRQRAAGNLTNVAAINNAAGAQTLQGLNAAGQFNQQAGQQLSQNTQFNANQAYNQEAQNAALTLQNRSQQNAAAQQLYGMSQQGIGQAAQTHTDGVKSAAAATATGAGLHFAGQNVGVGLNLAQNQTDLKREEMLTQEYGVQSGIGIAGAQMAQQQEAADNAMWASMLAAGATAMSDIRAKRDIEPAEVDLRPAQGYDYEYIEPDRHGQGQYSGPMAQDLLKSRGVDGSVVRQRDGKLGVDTNRLSLSTASGLGQEQRRVDDLEARFAELESMLATSGGSSRRRHIEPEAIDLDSMMEPTRAELRRAPAASAPMRDVDTRSLDYAADAPEDPYDLWYGGSPDPKAVEGGAVVTSDERTKKAASHRGGSKSSAISFDYLDSLGQDALDRESARQEMRRQLAPENPTNSHQPAPKKYEGHAVHDYEDMDRTLGERQRHTNPIRALGRAAKEGFVDAVAAPGQLAARALGASKQTLQDMSAEHLFENLSDDGVYEHRMQRQAERDQNPHATELGELGGEVAAGVATSGAGAIALTPSARAAVLRDIQALGKWDLSTREGRAAQRGAVVLGGGKGKPSPVKSLSREERARVRDLKDSLETERWIITDEYAEREGRQLPREEKERLARLIELRERAIERIKNPPPPAPPPQPSSETEAAIRARARERAEARAKPLGKKGYAQRVRTLQNGIEDAEFYLLESDPSKAAAVEHEILKRKRALARFQGDPLPPYRRDPTAPRPTSPTYRLKHTLKDRIGSALTDEDRGEVERLARVGRRLKKVHELRQQIRAVDGSLDGTRKGPPMTPAQYRKLMQEREGLSKQLTAAESEAAGDEVADTAEQWGAQNVRVADFDFKDVREKSREIFGQPMTPQQVKKLTGVEGAGPAGHGDLGYSHKVDYEGHNGRIAVTSSIETPTDVIGSVKNEYYRDPDTGDLTAHLDQIEVEDQFRGSGIARQVLKNEVEAYQAAGVKRIELQASADGKYVWPRMGFDLKNPSDLRVVKNDFLEWMERELGYTREQSLPLAKAPTNLQQLALTEVDAPGLSKAERQIGKRFLLEGQVRIPLDLKADLAPGSPSGDAVKQYLGVK